MQSAGRCQPMQVWLLGSPREQCVQLLVWILPQVKVLGQPLASSAFCRGFGHISAQLFPSEVSLCGVSRAQLSLTLSPHCDTAGGLFYLFCSIAIVTVYL